MSFTKIKIGRIERVASAIEAISCLQNHAEVAGVIWRDEVELPSLNQQQLDFLRDNHFVWTSNGGNSSLHIDNLHKLGEDGYNLTPYFELAAKDLSTAIQSRTSTPKRKHWYVKNEDISTLPHLDNNARHIWLHRHISGSGLRVFYPTGQEAVEVNKQSRTSQIVTSSQIEQLLQEGLISSFELSPNEAILFDNRLLHGSNKGHRFRSVVNGYGL